MVDSSAIITDDEDDTTIMQGDISFFLMVHSRQAFQNRRRNFLPMRQHQAAAASLLQRQWMAKSTRKKFRIWKKALVTLQACARRKYFWGVNDECSEILLNVLEFRNVLASMRHALSIVRYVQFLVDNSEFLNMVYTYKKD
jgi:hypothetical protein